MSQIYSQEPTEAKFPLTNGSLFVHLMNPSSADGQRGKLILLIEYGSLASTFSTPKNTSLSIPARFKAIKKLASEKILPIFPLLNSQVYCFLSVFVLVFFLCRLDSQSSAVKNGRFGLWPPSPSAAATTTKWSQWRFGCVGSQSIGTIGLPRSR